MSAAEKKDHLVKDSMILFIASSVVNLSNFVFHMYATRNLKPEEYGVLATLLAIVMIFTLPAYSLQMTVTKKTAAFKARGELGAIEHLFKRATVWFFALAVVIFASLFAASDFIRVFFRIQDKMMILILGGILLIGFILPVVRGVLQGLQKFLGLSAVLVTDALLRLGFLIAFVAAGFGVRGALGTTMCSTVVAYVVGLFLLNRIFAYKEKDAHLITKRELFSYAIPVLIANLGFSMLGYIDLFMVKHFFSESQAGLYAVTSIIGKAFLFFPAAVVMALFPKVAEHSELNKDTGIMLVKSLILTAAMSLAGIIFCFFFPKLVLLLLTGGGEYYEIAGVVRLVGPAIMPIVLMNVVLNYSLAIKRYEISYFIFAGIAVYAALLWFFHSSFYTVLGVLFGVNAVVLLLSIIVLIPFGKKAAVK